MPVFFRLNQFTSIFRNAIYDMSNRGELCRRNRIKSNKIKETKGLHAVHAAESVLLNIKSCTPMYNFSPLFSPLLHDRAAPSSLPLQKTISLRKAVLI